MAAIATNWAHFSPAVGETVIETGRRAAFVAKVY